jgi:hypothetical protein
MKNNKEHQNVKSLRLALLLGLLFGLNSCQSKAEQDKEFINGSTITIDALSERTIGDLALLGRVWGFVKYYHPAVGSGDYNWDFELFRIMPKILACASPEERNKLLEVWIDKLGTNDLVPSSDTLGRSNAKLLPDVKWTGDTLLLGSNLSRQLQTIMKAKRKGYHYHLDVKPALNPEFKNESGYQYLTYPDAGFRLLALYRYWTIVEYFFPYRHLIEEDWNAVLTTSISEFVRARNELEYKLALLKLMARVHDTHSNIWQQDTALARFKGKNRAPLEIKFAENKAVVTDVYDVELGSFSGLRRGDAIVSVSNRPVEEIIKDKLPFTPASNYPTQLRDIARNLLRSNNRALCIQYERDGVVTTDSIACVPPEQTTLFKKFQESRPSWKFMTNKIGYLFPGTIKSKDLPKIMSDFKNTRGIIIDFRCYPSEFVVFDLGEYLMKEPTDFVKFTRCSIEQPGLFTFTSPLKVGKNNTDYYKGKIVILVDESTQSSAEYHVMAFRVAPNATVIGSTTAAADGNVSQFRLPGGINTMITGLGVYYPDGRETQRIGIVPDIEVKPTVTGIRENRDELIEKAVEIINRDAGK